MNLADEIRAIDTNQSRESFYYDGFSKAREQAAELVEKREAGRAEKPVDYSTPTPQTDAFMLLIDDSEVDLRMIEAQLRDMEHERDHYKKLIENGGESGWQPIETCEMEHGKKILCYGDGYIFEAECEFDDGYGTWCNIGGDTPTHWMPLPEPPEMEAKQ